MSEFILIMLLFDGTLTTGYYPDKSSCEIALQKKVDLGNFKNIDEINCYPTKKHPISNKNSVIGIKK